LRTRHGLLFTLLLVVHASASGAATLPAGFTESPVASGLSNPTAMAIAPDGRIFVCQQGGALRVIKNSALLSTPFVTVPVNSDSERGLLGVALDPAFDSNHFVYVYYTATTPTTHNRVSRFTANGDVAVPGSEVPILNLETLSAGNHNGGAIHFGPDGKLYVAVGENAVASNSQTLSNRLGKMLRINADGSIPSDNPFFGTAMDANRAIWALGLRNPFTFAFNPGGPEMFINDVGAGSFEEINDGVAGSNYGWPRTEGPTTDPAFRSPRYAYDHDEGCAISGGAFYSPTTFQFPSDYTSDYFFADLCGGWIKRLDLTTNDVTMFATGISGPVDVHVGGDGSLYYLARGAGSNSGFVNRVQFTPLAPTLNAFTNGLTLSLSWSSSAGATSYRLEAGTASGAADLLNIDVGTITSIERVAPAGTYFMRVRAVGTLGPSAASDEATVRLVGPAVCATPPPPPTGYAAQTAGLNVVLSWNASPSATFYVLEAGSVSGAADILQASVGNVTSLATTGPPNIYFTRLRAANACGASAPSPEVRLTLSCTTSSPSNLRVIQAGSIVTFSWAAAPGATSYRAQIGSAPGLSNLVNVDIGAGTAVSASISGAPAGNYFVRIAANTPCGATGPSNEVIVTVP
jgi:glucose/arabinose dehydrogenase